MRATLILFILSTVLTACSNDAPPSNASSAAYKEQIIAHRQHYQQEFLTDEHSPLKAEDTSYLRFYEPDDTYRVTANFTATPDAREFPMPTHTGEQKAYRLYGKLNFTIRDTPLVLNVYQGIDLIKKDKKFTKYMFIPFTDETTFTETYGGGRYIDLSTDDLKDNTIILDFNKCYNPYCAYGGGYSCPIPPAENRLPVAIRAGEKNYGKPEMDDAHTEAH